MEVLKSWIVNVKGEHQLLVYLGDGNYMRTSTGAFGQRPMCWIEEYEEEALKLISGGK